MNNHLNEKKELADQMTTDTSIRVQVSLLDSLMTLAGELVLSRNQLLQTIAATEYHNVDAIRQTGGEQTAVANGVGPSYPPDLISFKSKK